MPRCVRPVSVCWRHFRTSPALRAPPRQLRWRIRAWTSSPQRRQRTGLIVTGQGVNSLASLKPGGWLVLLWNERLTDSTAFLRDYEELLVTYGTDYEEVRHERTTDAVNEFFDPAPFQKRVFLMRQEFDYAGVEGRLLSSSYAPGPDHPQYAPMLRELLRIFELSSTEGRVAFEYKTRLYFGHLL